MKHLAQWLVDSVWQIADMIVCSPRGLYIGQKHLWGGFFGGKEGEEGGRKVSKPRPFGVFRASGRELTFLCQS